MDADAVSRVWRALDRERLAALARSGPEPVFASVSGAHLYGFESPNSDVDLRGAFVLPARALLGLFAPEETVSRSFDDEGLELDWVAHDLRKFVRMMTQDNGYVLEQLYSPLTVVETPLSGELRELGKGCITRTLFRHYRGFAHGRRKLLAAPDATVKHLLYAYRVYLTGIHALTSGEIQAHLPTLNERFGMAVIDELVARKRAGAEKQKLADGEHATHALELDRLEEALVVAAKNSQLPDQATTVVELDELVIRARLERLA